MEVKNHQGIISVDSGRWTRIPYDRYGNPSTREAAAHIEDEGGRSPSEQVNEVADALETQVARRTSMNMTIRRIAVLTHERCEMGMVRTPGVDAVLKLDQVSPTSIFSGHSYDLSPQDTEEIAKAITGKSQ